MSQETPDQISPATLGGGSYRISGVSTGGRAYVLTGANASSASVTSPSTGGSIDGVAVEIVGSNGSWVLGIPRTPGFPVQVRAGGSVTSGNDLQVQGDGDFVPASGGTVVAEAMESASSGQHFWAKYV